MVRRRGKRGARRKRRSRRSKLKQNEKAGIVGIIGGILMLLTGITGLSTWARAGEAALAITGIEALGTVFLVLMLIGGLGGLAVILGSWLIMSKVRVKRKHKVKTGKALVSIGAGFGLFGLIVLVAVTFVSGALIQLIAGINLGLIGLILTIYARDKAVP